jgi:hypothetical protein
MQFHDDSRHAPLAEWHQHAPADYRRGSGWQTVGESHVQRYGQDDIAEFGHPFQRIAVPPAEK